MGSENSGGASSAKARENLNRSGRKPGSRNRATAEAVEAIARAAATDGRGEAALDVFEEVMLDPAAPETARVAAAKALLDRAVGRPFQAQRIEHATELPRITIFGVDPSGRRDDGTCVACGGKWGGAGCGGADCGS